MDAELERILVEDYLDGLAAIEAAELRSRRGECQVVETQLSYLRRLVQGRHDIVTSEIDHRRGGGDPGDVTDLVGRLPVILADRLHGPGTGRLPAGLEPGELRGRLVDRLDAITDALELGAPQDAAADVLVRAADELADLELEISSLRRSLFDRIDAIQAELTRRYRDGETTVDDLLRP